MQTITRIYLYNLPKIVKDYPSDSFVRLSSFAKFEDILITALTNGDYISRFFWNTSESRILKIPESPDNIVDLKFQKRKLTKLHGLRIPIEIRRIQ